jgi:nucleoside-diphosphate-sugar epimerase
VTPVLGDVLDPDSLSDLPPAETVLFAIGFDRRSGRSIREVYVDGLGNALDAISDACQRFLYISSTGVYGQRDGSWVDESSPCSPTREGGIACRDAEERLRAHRWGPRSAILRLAGLYGPGRIPRRNDLLSSKPLSAPPDGYLNLIHRDDAAAAVLAAERLAPRPSVYCVSDGHPVRRGEYYAELARQLNAPPPRYGATQADEPAVRRAGASKRVRNERMLRELQLRLSCPTYREGLAAIIADEADPPGPVERD